MRSASRFHLAVSAAFVASGLCFAAAGNTAAKSPVAATTPREYFEKHFPRSELGYEINRNADIYEAVAVRDVPAFAAALDEGIAAQFKALQDKRYSRQEYERQLRRDSYWQSAMRYFRQKLEDAPAYCDDDRLVRNTTEMAFLPEVRAFGFTVYFEFGESERGRDADIAHTVVCAPVSIIKWSRLRRFSSDISSHEGFQVAFKDMPKAMKVIAESEPKRILLRWRWSGLREHRSRRLRSLLGGDWTENYVMPSNVSLQFVRDGKALWEAR